MKRDVLTESETRYVMGFKPAGFIRTWNALYDSKCLVIARPIRLLTKPGKSMCPWCLARCGRGVTAERRDRWWC
jgi:hypothetical protein